MSSPQTIALVASRFRIRQATLLTALGVLVAIAVSIAILALTGANHTTAMSPVAASGATSASVAQVRYLGPRQMRAAANPPTAQMQAGGTLVVHYTCLGAARHCVP